MEKYEKIKKNLREKGIPFEKKHKKDDCTFIPFEDENYIAVYTRYMPYVRKDNSKSVFADVHTVYDKFYSYWSIFDKEENFILSESTTKEYVVPIFLDKNNIIILSENYNYYHYKYVNKIFIACTLFNNILTPHILKQNGVILTDNKLYDFIDEYFINIPDGFEIIYDKDHFDNIFKSWKIENYYRLIDLLINKLKNKKLFCLLKQISYCEENISVGYNVIALMDKFGDIVSDLFYRKDNEIVSIKIDKPINEIFNDLEHDCKEKVQEYIRKNKSISLSDEIIKKLEL